MTASVNCFSSSFRLITANYPESVFKNKVAFDHWRRATWDVTIPITTWLFAAFRTELHGGEKHKPRKGGNCKQKPSSITCTIVWALRVLLEFPRMDRLIRYDGFPPLVSAKVLWPPGTSPVNDLILVELCLPASHLPSHDALPPWPVREGGTAPASRSIPC